MIGVSNIRPGGRYWPGKDPIQPALENMKECINFGTFKGIFIHVLELFLLINTSLTAIYTTPKYSSNQVIK